MPWFPLKSRCVGPSRNGSAPEKTGCRPGTAVNRVAGVGDGCAPIPVTWSERFEGATGVLQTSVLRHSGSAVALIADTRLSSYLIPSAASASPELMVSQGIGAREQGRGSESRARLPPFELWKCRTLTERIIFHRYSSLCWSCTSARLRFLTWCLEFRFRSGDQVRDFWLRRGRRPDVYLAGRTWTSGT